MLHPSTKRLIDTLGERTRQKKVEWAESDSGSVTHDTEGYRVEITPEPHTIFLLDALGKELDKVEPHEYNDATDDDDRPYSQFVSELFREAHRHARGTERAIELLLAGLADTDEDAEEETPEIVPDIVETVAEPEAVIDETNVVETLPETHLEEAAPEPEPQVFAQDQHIEEATTESEAEDSNQNDIWPAAALATNGLAVMNDDEPKGELEEAVAPLLSDQDFAQPDSSNAVSESDAEPEPFVTEDIAPPVTDIATDESQLELSEEDASLENDAPLETSIPQSLGSVMRFDSEPATQSEDIAPFEDVSQTPPSLIEDVPTSEPISTAISDTTIDSIDTARDRLAGFAPVDIEEPASAYVPDDTPTETPEPIKQSYSLSGIGAGFGLGAAPSVITNLQDTTDNTLEEAHDADLGTLDDDSESNAAFIDGTTDLPDTLPASHEDLDLEHSLVPAPETFESPQNDTAHQIDETHFPVESAEEIEAETASSSETSGIFTGILQRGRNAVEKTQDTIEETAEATHKVIDDLAGDDTAENDIKPKTTPRFNPWN